MTSRRPDDWKLRPTGFLFLAAAMLLSLSGMRGAEAGDMQAVDPQPMSVAASPGPLDGQAFTGDYGPVGEPADGTDTWIFENGSFYSKACLDCGFPQSVYTTESGSGGIEFSSTTACPETDAVIVWEGTVKDGRIEGVYTWTRERWYRTVRKQYWFKGTLQGSAVSRNDKGS